MLRGYSYQLYEMAHAALAPARAVSDAAHFVFRNPFNPLSNTAFGKNIAAGRRTVRTDDAPLRQAGVRPRQHRRRRRRARRARGDRLDPALLQSASFRPPDPPRPRVAAETADRRADVRPLRDAAARHGRGVPADPSRLHHRLDRRAHGAAGRAAASISTTTSTISARCSSISAPASTRSASASPPCR